jgi:hypothetical protein
LILREEEGARQHVESQRDRDADVEQNKWDVLTLRATPDAKNTTHKYLNDSCSKSKRIIDRSACITASYNNVRVPDHVENSESSADTAEYYD